MKIVDTAKAYDDALRQLIEAHKCTLVSTRLLALEAKACRDAVSAFDLESNALISEGFFHYIVTDGIAIFLVDGDPFLTYVFRCNPHDVITYVEGEIDTSDVDQCKYYLGTILGQSANLGVSNTIAYQWMDQH